MKMNLWLLCGMMVSTALLAQQATNSPGTGPIETPAPAPAATTPAGPGAETPARPGRGGSHQRPRRQDRQEKERQEKERQEKSGNKAAPAHGPPLPG